MIATTRLGARTPRAGRPAGRIPALLTTVAAALGACGAPGWNAVREARGDSELQGLDRRVEEYRREVVKREESLRALRDSVAELDARIAEVRTARQAAEQELSRQLATLTALEEDGDAARQRAGEIEQQLAGMRKLERELASRQQRLQELNGQMAAKDQELATAQQALKARTEEVDAALAKVAEARAEVEQRGAAVTAGQQALEAALEATAKLFPPPPPPEKPAGEGGEAKKQ